MPELPSNKILENSQVCSKLEFLEKISSILADEPQRSDSRATKFLSINLFDLAKSIDIEGVSYFSPEEFQSFLLKKTNEISCEVAKTIRSGLRRLLSESCNRYCKSFLDTKKEISINSNSFPILHDSDIVDDELVHVIDDIAKVNKDSPSAHLYLLFAKLLNIKL